MSSRSSAPAPRGDESSAQSVSADRPRYLRVSHASSLRERNTAAIAPTQNAVREDTDATADSCNLRAAEWLTREREESGLTMEEAAEAARVSTTTIWRRENGLVDLGPLKQLVALRKRGLMRVK